MLSRESFVAIWGILKPFFGGIFQNAGNINELTQAILSITGVIFAFNGIRYIRTLRKKTEEATFGYWLLFLNWLRQLKARIEQDNNLVNNLYSPSCRGLWRGYTPCDIDALKAFKVFAEQMLDFLKTSPEQMPAYPGWCSDYGMLVTFLTDCIIYDVTESDKSFKFIDKPGGALYQLSDRNQYCTDICKVIRRMTTKIEEKQTTAEEKLYKGQGDGSSVTY